MWPFRRAQNNRKWPKTPRTRGPLLWTARKSKLWPRCAFSNVPGLLGWRWMGLPSLRTPLSGSSKEVHSAYIAKVLEQPLLLPKDMDAVRKLKQQDLFMSLKRDLTMVSSQPHNFYLLNTSLFFFHMGLLQCFCANQLGGLCGWGMGQGGPKRC